MDYKNKKDLEHLYLVGKYGSTTIGKMFGVSEMTILYHLKKNGITLRPHSESMSLRFHNHCNVDDKLLEFLYGELLGDMCLQCHSNYSAHICYGTKLMEYIEWLRDYLSGYEIEQIGVISKYTHKEWGCTTYQYRSKSYPELAPIRKMFYPDGKKIIPLEISISPILLRQWYIGDGTLGKPPKGHSFALLCSMGFKREDVVNIIAKINDIGIKAVLQPSTNNIRIPASSTPDFLNYIGPCPVECYKYKWALS